MGAESWAALNEVVGRGKVDYVHVGESTLSAASDQQISALWRATEVEVRWVCVDHCYVTIAQKSEGEVGLKKLVTQNLMKNAEVDVKRVRCETDEAVKTLCTDLALAQTWRIRELHLPDKMGSESLEALCKVASKWNLGLVIVDKLMLGETQERVNTWCTVLCFAKQWKV